MVADAHTASPAAPTDLPGGARLEVVYADFPQRARRAEFIARRFAAHLHGAVLDVGCDEAVLRGLLPGCRYFGVDLGGKPDLKLDLEAADRLPFEDRSYDCVVCSDVLEHLANLHPVFRELTRIAARSVIVSLPNNWVNARRPIARGRGRIGFYGLPLDPPPDRHKWFFNLEEARTFLVEQARREGFRVAELFAMEKPRVPLVRWVRRAMHATQMRYLNRFAHTLWVVLTRPGDGAPRP